MEPASNGPLQLFLNSKTARSARCRDSCASSKVLRSTARMPEARRLVERVRVGSRKDARPPGCLVPDRSPRKQWNPSPPWDPLLPGIFFFERPANRSCSRLQITAWRLATPRLPGTDLCGIWRLVTYFGGKAAAGLVLPWLRSPERGRSRVTPHSGECSYGEIICCRSPKAAAGEKSRVDFGVRSMRITGR